MEGGEAAQLMVGRQARTTKQHHWAGACLHTLFSELLGMARLLYSLHYHT